MREGMSGGNAHEILRRHRWQKLVGEAREGHNKWRADTLQVPSRADSSVSARGKVVYGAVGSEGKRRTNDVQEARGKGKRGHNKWRADTRGTYGGGCKYRAEQT